MPRHIDFIPTNHNKKEVQYKFVAIEPLFFMPFDSSGTTKGRFVDIESAFGKILSPF